jgi:uncharacterized protein (TIGR02302 family)
MDRNLRRLQGRRTLARLVILFERLWPALWPPLGVAGLFACLALLDIPRILPPWMHAGLLVATALAFLLLLFRGLRRVALPDDRAGDRRLERASGLSHRPLSVLADRPARANAEAEALWRAHVARAVAQVQRLRVGAPRPGLARYDRRALRVGLVVALVAALGIAGWDAPSRLARAMQPALPLEAAPPSTQLQAWITPPGYTRLAPVFLKPEGGSVAVPAGSHLTVNLSGGTGEPSLSLSGHAEPFRALDQESFQADRDLPTGGRLEVLRHGRALAAWDLTVVADQPPRVAWAEPPGGGGRSLQTRLPWQVSDDYGVTSLAAELRLQDRPSAPPLVITIPLPGGEPKTAKGVRLQDLTAHPWAGLPVIGKLIGRDASSQTGESSEAMFELPERAFEHPVAQALIRARKLLSQRPDDRDPVIAALRRLLAAPEALGGDSGAYVNLGALYALLVRERDPGTIEQAQQRMWELALHFEEGAADRTARALEAAREAVREALDKSAKEPTDANRQELEQKLKELEKAIQEHMQALAEQARREMAEMPDNAQSLDSREMQQKAEQAREAAREGRMNDARQKMAELEQMLDQLRNARPAHAKPDRQNAERRQRAKKEMGALQDMIGRQGGLLDQAQQRAAGGDPNAGQRPPSQRSNGSNPPNGPTRPGDRADKNESPASPSDAQRDTDRRVQQALRRALGELMQQMGDLTGKVPPSLGEADTAMRDAGQALSKGQDDAAGAAEQRAIEALQKGGQEMGQQMAQFGAGQPGEDEGDQDGDPNGTSGFTLQDGQNDKGGARQGAPSGQRRRSDRRDPLGRQFGNGNSGADEANDVQVPEEMERQRTRAIQEELRRRGGERTRPQQELDYIDRLLKQF